jgi:cysteine desulfurase / selenocysteine lyase
MSIYLDNAATTFPKPDEVYRAVDYALREIGVGPGRGGHHKGMEATRLVFEARETLADFFGIKDSSRLIFTHSATEGLNLAIAGLLQAGDHVITSTMEHNSLARPLYRAVQGGVEVTRVDCDRHGFVDRASVAALIRPQTRLIALSHCSNVTGTIQPVVEIGRIARQAGVVFLLDAAQSAGLVDIDVNEFMVDLLAVPGHKGLFGPQGTGVLYVAEGIELEPLLVGGTGGYSSSSTQPDALPERYEAGTLNTPGIAGLKAGVDFINATGLKKIRGKEASLASQVIAGLKGIAGLTVHGPENPDLHCGPVSFTVEGFDPAIIGFTLDREYEICVRVGLQCAPDAHKTIGSYPEGTIRVSPGFFNTEMEIEFFHKALRNIINR